MTRDNMIDIETIYRLEDDVYLSFDKTTECSRILKLNDDNIFYQANLVAAEIVNMINGKNSVNVIVKEVAQSYDSKFVHGSMTSFSL